MFTGFDTTNTQLGVKKELVPETKANTLALNVDLSCVLQVCSCLLHNFLRSKYIASLTVYMVALHSENDKIPSPLLT
jgi:hypothetical protein